MTALLEYVVNMASPPRPQQQYAKPPPCWPHLDDILRNRLAWLHHSIGRDALSPTEGAREFSHIVSDLLLEYEVITLPTCNGRHRPRKMEMTASQRIFMAKDCREWF